ncbi:MAG: aminotransferase class III [Bacteroidetes bacterium GWA2_30_7]|nr:MAG: aminotransferase class III [Bacteroidetes bacterium GWA2_30_7]
MSTLRQLFLNNLAQTSENPLAIEVEKAKGVYLYSKSGTKYIDLISGISVSNLGHCNKRVTKTVNNQLKKFTYLMVYGEYVISPQVELASKLVSLLPANLNSVYFVNSGSEAVEGAIKLAKRFTGRNKIISFKNAYHGSTSGALSVMGNEFFKQQFRPLLPGIDFILFNNFEDIERITDNYACVIVEPIQGEAGVQIPEKNFLLALREKCNQTNTLLIFDEIQTGIGRTGKMFAFENFNVIPDILLLAKAFGGGFPLGAFISSKEIMSVLSCNPPLGHITTFGGHPISCVASLETIKILEETKIYETAVNKGLLIKKLLNHKKIINIRQIGLFISVELENEIIVKNVIDYAIQKGVIIDWFLFAPNCIRIAPPVIIIEKEIRKVCKIINEGIEQA